MKVSGNELLFIYNSMFFRDKRALGYVQTLDGYQLREWDLARERLTPLQIVQLADHLKIKVIHLLDQGSQLFKKVLKDKNAEESDLIQIMSRNPEVLNTPIALYEDRGVFVTDSFSLIKDSFEA